MSTVLYDYDVLGWETIEDLFIFDPAAEKVRSFSLAFAELIFERATQRFYVVITDMRTSGPAHRWLVQEDPLEEWEILTSLPPTPEMLGRLAAIEDGWGA